MQSVCRTDINFKVTRSVCGNPHGTCLIPLSGTAALKPECVTYFGTASRGACIFGPTTGDDAINGSTESSNLTDDNASNISMDSDNYECMGDCEIASLQMLPPVVKKTTCTLATTSEI